MMKMDRLKKENGITLVALVVSIIVLLILSGISISMLSGDNGVLRQATNAKEKTDEAQEREGIEIATLSAQTGSKGYQELNQINLQEAIDLQFGTGKAIVTDNGDGTFTVSFIESKKDYNITSTGVENGVNWNDAMKQAKAPESQITTSKSVIGISTDGQPVNMDLWTYEMLDDGTYSIKYSTEENTIIDGKIIGLVPKYIKENSKWIEVTDMTNCFINNTNLIYPPIIPNTVKILNGSFAFCTNLEIPPSIHYGVIEMRSTFSGCTTLREMPKLPDSVQIINSAFANCNSIEAMKAIPDSVTSMRYTFNNCIKLKNISNIPKNIQDLYATFSGCVALQNVYVVIPNTITNLGSTFKFCPNLSGYINISDGSIQNYVQCFYNSATSENSNLVLGGSCIILNEILNTKSSNSKITLNNN